MTAMIPYAAVGTNRLDEAYVKCLSMVPSGEWLCSLDHDVMFMCKDWHRRFEALLDRAAEEGYGSLTCTLSDTPNPHQQVQAQGLKDKCDSTDIVTQWGIGQKLSKLGDAIEDIPNGIPAVVVISKDAAEKSGLLDLPYPNPFYGSGGQIRARLREGGYKHGIVRSIYAYHRYNATSDRGDRGYNAYYAELEKEMLQS